MISPGMMINEKPQRLRQQPRGAENAFCGGVLMDEFTPACYRPTRTFPGGRTGTEAGYAAHRRVGEQACESCLLANNLKSDERRLKAEQDPEYQERRRLRSRAAEKRYRERNPDRSKDSRSRYYRIRRQMIDDAKSVPCTDCGVQYPPYVMQFDHLDPQKKLKGVGQLVSHSEDAIRAEIAKCEVVCANCHAERTHRQRLARKNKEVTHGQGAAEEASPSASA